MKEYYPEIQDFLANFQRLIDRKNDLKLVTDTYFKYNGQFKMLDAILVKENEALALFEFRPNSKSLEEKELLYVFVPPNVSVKFVIISNGISHKVLNRNSNETHNFQEPEELLTFLTKIPSSKEINATKEKIAKEIENQIKEFFVKFDETQHPLNFLEEKIKQHFNKLDILKNIQYNRNGQFYHLSKDIRDLSNFENTFFKLLIKDVSEGELIFRYTTLETLFSTINYKSLRLNGLAGMNDTSEIGYVEKILDEEFEPFKNLSDIDELNRRFILCSSTLPDDLMQWRLYGDDCNGACLVFQYDTKKEIPGLQVRKINYGIKKRGKNYHPELELVSSIINSITNKFQESFQFRALAIWKHFFKSFEYSPEKEVRLLIIQSENKSLKGEKMLENDFHTLDKKWSLTNSHKIANPYITIKLEDPDLPLKLYEIVLGTKSPEISINKNQFRQLLRERDLLDVQIRESEINNYR